MPIEKIIFDPSFIETHSFRFKSIDNENYLTVVREDENMFTILINNEPVQYFNKETAQALSKFLGNG